MDRFLGWLRKEWTGWKLFFGPLACFLLTLAYLKLIIFLKIGFFQSAPPIIPPILTPGILIPLIIYYLLMALMEELFFRVPIAIIYNGFSGGLSLGFLIFIIILSAVFGLCHGSFYNIILQGVHGLIFSLVFIKTGGLDLGLGTLRGWFIAATVHASYNISLLVLSAVLS